MDATKKESQLTRPLFEKAVEQLTDIIASGVVIDKAYTTTLLQVFGGHIKALNSERANNALKYAIARDTASNSEEVKSIIQKSLPEYL